MKKHNVYILSDELRAFCIRNNYFTCGTSEQYSRLFELNDNGASIDILASIIWTCSDGADLAEIEAGLEEMTRCPIYVENLRRTLEDAAWGEAEIDIICEAVRTHPEAGKAYKVIED